VDAVKKQLLSQYTVSLAWDRWASPNKLTIPWVIAYDEDQNWPFRKVELALDEVDCLFFSPFKS